MTTNEMAAYIATQANKRTNDEDKAAFVVNFLTELVEMAERTHTEIREGK